MRLSFTFILTVLFIALVNGATKKTEVVRFRPITREEYNEILKLTNGKTTISEARLISSGLAVLKNLATYTTRLWPNLWSVFGITQTTTAGILEDSDNSYPLCVVSSDKQTNNGDYEDDINNLPSMDCIIVVRKSEHEEEENYEEQYYDDQEPISMLPDYQHYPYAAITPQHAYPYPPPIPAPPPPPYQPYPYAAYQPYPYYPQFLGYPQQQFAPQYLQPAMQQYPQSGIPQYPQSGIPQHMEAQNQEEYQTQADYYNQPNYAHFNAPFYAPTLPPPQSNFNSNSGPIVHVIRGDKREIGQQRRLGHQKLHINKVKRPRRRVFRNSVENGYVKTTVPRQQYSSETYPKVSLSRSAPYDGPVYIMKAEKFY